MKWYSFHEVNVIAEGDHGDTYHKHSILSGAHWFPRLPRESFGEQVLQKALHRRYVGACHQNFTSVDNHTKLF